MTPEVFMSLRGDVMIAVRAKDEYNIRDLVHIKKIKSGMLPYHVDYDFNNDGVIDDTDLTLMRSKLLTQ